MPIMDGATDRTADIIASTKWRMVSAKGDGGGNHTTTSSTFADIHATLYDLSIAAVAGDQLLITFSTQWFHSAVDSQLRIRFTAAGTAIASMPTNGLYCSSERASTSKYNEFAWTHTVVSGDISGGLVAVVPQFATNASTATVRNDTTNGLPLFRIVNFGPP